MLFKVQQRSLDKYSGNNSTEIKLSNLESQITIVFYDIQIKNNTNTNFSQTIRSHAKQLASDLEVLPTRSCSYKMKANVI